MFSLTMQINKVDFTKWLNVASYKSFPDEITGVRAYDISALPKQKAIAVTDADKVKVFQRYLSIQNEICIYFPHPMLWLV